MSYYREHIIVIASDQRERGNLMGLLRLRLAMTLQFNCMSHE